MSTESVVPLGREQVAQFCDFYKAEYTPLVWLLICVGAREEAEDIAQEAMREALIKWPNVHSAKAFVRTVAIRALHRRRESARREAKAWQRVTQDTVVVPFDADEDVEHVMHMLEALPDAQRLAFALYYDGYRYAEIADITGQHQATVRSHVRHARQNLTRMLDRVDQEGGNPWIMIRTSSHSTSSCKGRPRRL